MKGGEIINGFEKCRKQAGLTQIDAAKLLNVAQCTISQWETGSSYPTGNKLKAIAELYGCTIDQLFERKEDNT